MVGRTNTGGGGGSGGLNFQVIGGTTAPNNPKENTIWVNTSTKITGWVFSATQPTGATGMVWISVGVSSPAAFNALKKNNNITIYPVSAKQYVSGAWVDKTAKSYQNGAWVYWWNGHLYEYGNQYESFTGGWTSTGYKGHNYNTQSNFNDDNIYIYATSGSAVGGVGTANKIDLSGRTKLKLLYDASSANGSHLSVLKNKSDDIANAPLAKATLVTGTSQTVTLDITDIAEGYVAITSKTPVYIYDVWME